MNVGNFSWKKYFILLIILIVAFTFSFFLFNLSGANALQNKTSGGSIGGPIGGESTTGLPQGLPGFGKAGLPGFGGGGPFGGRIIWMEPCLVPPGLHLQLSGPVGGEFLYIPGPSRSYLFGPPTHPGQWLLGMSSKRADCLIKLTPKKIKVSGNLILFHGSSR